MLIGPSPAKATPSKFMSFKGCSSRTETSILNDGRLHYVNSVCLFFPFKLLKLYRQRRYTFCCEIQPPSCFSLPSKTLIYVFFTGAKNRKEHFLSAKQLLLISSELMQLPVIMRFFLECTVTSHNNKDHPNLITTEPVMQHLDIKTTASQEIAMDLTLKEK